MPTTAATDLQLRNAGFTLVLDRTTLYTHKRYPGFMFKIVTDIDQAMACGGVMHFSSKRRVMTLGYDMFQANAAGQLGNYGRFSALKRTVRKDAATITYATNFNYAPGVGAFRREYSTRLEAITPVWNATTHATDVYYVGVITKASRGIIVDRRSLSATGADLNTSLTMVKLAGYTYVGDAGYQILDSPLISDIVVAGMTLTEPEVMGYIAMGITVKKRTWLEAAKPKFIEGLVAEGVDDEIIARHEAAFDAEIAEIGAAAVVPDELVFHVANSASNTVHFTHVRPVSGVRILAGQNAGTGSATGATLQAFTAPNVVGEPGYVGTNADATAQAALRAGVISQLVNIGGNRNVGGVPVPQVLTRDTPLDNFLIIPTGAANASAFRLTSVPYESVSLAVGQDFPASQIFGAFGPKVGPRLLTPPAGVLDLKNRIEVDLGVSSTLAGGVSAFPGGTAEEDAESVGDKIYKAIGEATNDLEEAKIGLLPFTYFVAKTSNDIVQRVKQR